MRDGLFNLRVRRLRAGFDVVLMLALAASYPLYVQLDALPRADEFGPPVPDRFPWLVAFVLLAYLGYRCRTVAACARVSTLVSVSAGLAHTDAADVTGVAKSPLLLSLAAIVLVFTTHVLGRRCSRSQQRGPRERGTTHR